MKFLNTAALWMLMGIPVLILIYLIKSKHEERAVSSTFIWKLSEKFMKQRVPLQRLRKILIFLLQLALIAGIALMAAKPVIMQGEAIHYIVILDASATMQTTNSEGITRFERAVEAIETLAAETEKGHTVSLILASDSATGIFTRQDSETSIKRALVNLSCTNGTADIDGAVAMAEDLAAKSGAVEVMIFTDMASGENANITVVDLSEEEWNVSVSGLTYRNQGKETTFTGTLTNTRSETITVGLKINGKLKDATKVEMTAGETCEVKFTLNTTHFDTAEIYVETKDGLKSDNSYAVCRSGNYASGVLIYSDSPTYLESVFSAQEDCTVTVVSSSDEEVDFSGYDLYIFDGIVPDEIPTDGSVWYINTEYMPEGITVKQTVKQEENLKIPQDANGIFYDDLSFTDTAVARYGSLSGNGNWSTLLFCGDDSVMMSKTLSNGLKEIYLSFDIHDSNLPLRASFVIMARNIIRYSIPQILQDSNYTIGDTISMAELPNAELLYVKTPSGSAEQIVTKGIYGVYVPEETGVYTAVETTEGGGEYMDFFVHLPESELTGSGIISGYTITESESEGRTETAIQKLVFWFAVAALVLILGEWGLYYYEQF